MNWNICIKSAKWIVIAVTTELSCDTSSCSVFACDWMIFVWILLPVNGRKWYWFVNGGYIESELLIPCMRRFLWIQHLFEQSPWGVVPSWTREPSCELNFMSVSELFGRTLAVVESGGTYYSISTCGVQMTWFCVGIDHNICFLSEYWKRKLYQR